MALTISANVNNLSVIYSNSVAPNDIYLDANGNLATSNDLQCVLENCSEAARTLLGEMILNTDQGIPYFQVVWVGVPNETQFAAALRLAFLSVTGVVEVVTLMTSQV